MMKTLESDTNSPDCNMNNQNVRSDTSDVIYDVLRPSHKASALKILTQAFVNEPSTASQSIGRPSKDQWRQFIDYYMDECSTNGLSTVALDAHNPEAVVGAIISREFLSQPDPHVIDFVQEPSPFAPLANAMEVLDEAWFASHPEIDRKETGRVADLWMGGVSPAMRDRGIASRLGRLALGCLIRAGFEYVICECTGAYSQNAAVAGGFKAIYELPYAEFLWNGEAIFQKTPAPLTHWAIYELKLR